MPAALPMTPLRAVIGAKLRMAGHWVASVRSESRLKVGFVSISALLLWIGAFFVVLGLLRFLQRFAMDLFGAAEQGIMDILLTRLLSVGSLVVLVLLLTSNVLVSFATVYRAREVLYLVQAPITRAEFFLGRLWECCWLSSWALAFIGSPVLLAYGLHRDVPLAFYLALPLFFPVFVTIPAALGAIVTIVLVRVLARRRGTAIGLGILASGLLFLLFRASGGLPDFDEAQSVAAVADLLGRAEQPLLPSNWLSRGLLAAAVGDLATVLFYWTVMAVNAVFLVWIATLFAERWFYPGWTDLLGSDERRSDSRRRLLSGLERLLPMVPEPVRSLIAKDFRLFWRDPAQWSQFLIFFGLMALYVANMRSGSVLGDERFRSWIAILNMAASMLVLATLTTRFVFPLISLEGRRFWVLGLAPVTLRRLMAQKFLLSVGTCSVFTVGLSLLTAWRLELQRFELAVTLFGVVASTLALSGLAVGLGALYPNFREDNPARITSGLGGTLNFILSLVFIVAAVSAQTFLVQWQRSEEISEAARRIGLSSAALFVVLLAGATTVIPLRLGLRNLRRSDF